VQKDFKLPIESTIFGYFKMEVKYPDVHPLFI